MSDTNDITTEPPRLTESQLGLLFGSCRVWDSELHGWVPGREASVRLRWTEAEIDRLRAELAKSNAQRDAARLEIVDALKEMHTTSGLRRELKRRGWAEWYMEVKP